MQINHEMWIYNIQAWKCIPYGNWSQKNTHSLPKAILFGYMQYKSLIMIYNKNKVNHKDKYKAPTKIWIPSNPDFIFKVQHVKCKKLIHTFACTVLLSALSQEHVQQQT
jgi:ribosomal protein L10